MPLKMSFLAILCLVVLTTSTVARAGWMSGGGELLQDARNPWFLENTKTVRYCIDVDAQNFGQPLAVLRARLGEALDFWRHAFVHAEKPIQVWGAPLLIATQEFEEVACDQQLDIRFQFGVLSEQQRQQLPDTRRFVGLTIRTDYDAVHMKGRGFVYISPESGPLAVTTELATKNPWSMNQGYLLKPILIHELGHIFGFDHTDRVPFMSAGFSEAQLDRDQASYNAQTWEQGYTPDVFTRSFTQKSANWIFGNSPGSARLSAFFGLGIQNDSRFLSLLLGNQFQIKKHYRDRPNETILTTVLTRFDPPSALHNLVSVWFPPEQEVFPVRFASSSRILPAARQQTLTLYGGSFARPDGIQQSIVISVPIDGKPRFTGVADGQLYSDIEIGM